LPSIISFASLNDLYHFVVAGVERKQR